MNKIIVLSTITGLVVGGVVGFAFGMSGGGGGHYRHDMNDKDTYMSETKERGAKPHAGTDGDTSMGMMDHSMHGAMMVTSERALIEGMIPHHEEAIKTANEVLARGATTPEMRTLAEGIITAQTKEVTEMKTWYQTWYNTPYTPSNSYKPMMRELKDLRGAALDRVFLEDMIQHHMGALMMSESVQSHLEHDELRALTQSISESQSKEITLMKQLLTTIQ